MTVQGGGGGRRIPPGAGGTPAKPTPSTNDAQTKTSTTKETAKPSSQPPAPASPSTTRDAFDAEGRTVERAIALEAPSTSGVDSMVRVLEDTREKILLEHTQVRLSLARLIGELVVQRFEASIFEAHREDILAHRTRMSALRRRLRQVQRRLKTLGKGHKLIGPHLERLQELEPGISRALLALQLVEAAFVEGSNSHKHGGDISAAAGDAFARSTLGQAAIVELTSLIDGKPEEEKS